MRNNVETFFNKYSKEAPKFKKIIIYIFFGYLPILSIVVILNLFEILPVNFNGEKIYGAFAALINVGFSPLIILMFSFFIYIHFYLGYLTLKLLNYILK